MRKIALMLALLTLTLTLPTGALEGQAFRDVPPDAWYYTPVELCRRQGLIAGYPDGTFRPQAAISRAELCALLLGGLVMDEASGSRPWYAPYTEYAARHGYLDADDWSAPATRSEAAFFLHRLSEHAPIEPLYRRLTELVNDWSAIPDAHGEAVLWALATGMMVGLGDGRFDPQGTLTRAQCATLLGRRTGLLAPQPLPIPALPVDGLKAIDSSGQIVTVTTSGLDDYKAVVNTYELADGVWLQVRRDLPAVCGSRGLMYNRRQNSYRSPVGNFGIVFAFGAQENPGVHGDMEYRAVTPESYWVLDSSSPLYNRWNEGLGGFKDREHLQSFGYQYDYALVLDFNYHSPVKGDGGAIFMHVATHDGKGTAGCIGLAQSDLLSIMTWLDPGKNPRVIICPEGDLKSY